MRKRIIILAAVMTLVLSGSWLLGVSGSKLYDSSSYGAARVTWIISRLLPFSQGEELRYNIGNTYYQQADYEMANQKYQEVTAITDSDTLLCYSLYNWSSSLQKIAEKAEAEQDPVRAIAGYGEALQKVSRQRCLDQDEFAELFTAQIELLEMRIFALLQPSEGTESDDSDQSDEDSDDQEETTDQQREELDNVETEINQIQQRQEDERFDNRDSSSFDTIL